MPDGSSSPDATHSFAIGTKDYVVPESPDELEACLADWEWRICSGQIYKIKIKDKRDGNEEDDEDDTMPSIVAPFRPNAGQIALLNSLWTRNLILKARQIGFSTLICILALDYAATNANVTVVIVCQDLDAAKRVMMRDKIKFAYHQLPPEIKQMWPLATEAAEQIVFEHNGSSITVTTSARSGTVQFLHVSEMGKIAAQTPMKATEITTGTIPALTPNGIGFIESTAEGTDGAFYVMAENAKKKKDARKTISKREWRFHFFPWFIEPGYRIPYHDSDVVITAKDHLYFDEVEVAMNVSLDLDQRAWYVTERDNTFAHEPELMWREYPSTPAEAWRASNEAKYLHKVIMRARIEGRIGNYPMIQHIPCNTFWDLGATDATPIWVHQPVQGWDRWVNFRETSLESYLDDVLWLEDLGCVFDTHYLPHDASHNEKDVERITSAVTKLRSIRPNWNWVVVPRTKQKIHSINNLRLAFPSYQFHEPATMEGLKHLENYSRDFNTRLQAFMNQPRHDEHSHAADAIMQHSDGYQPESRGKNKRPARRPSGLTS